MKFICNGCEKPCILDAGYYPELTTDSLRCVVGNNGLCKWEKYDDGKVAKLPKLTADVFYRPDCPEWAQFAAVDGCGRGFYYEAFPRLYKYDRFFLLSTVQGKTQRIHGKFDGENWINSIVARQKKPSLPDWCKKGKWVWYKRNGYGEIKSVRDDRSACYIEFDGGAGDFVQEALAELKLARLRPYNAEEMKALVGKVIEVEPGQFSLCLRVKGVWADFLDDCATDDDRARIISYNHDMLRRAKYIDNSPCGVLEHLNDEGELVR